MSKESKQLIPFIRSDKDNELLIDARLLHQRLNSKQQFADWVKNRINEYGFVENLDFFINLRKSKGLFGRPKKEYHLSLDMAKELAMVERSPMGRQIRQYFISAEKEWRSKRLYGQVATISEIKKKVRLIDFGGRVLYHHRDVKRVLGMSTRSSASAQKKRYPGQFALINRHNYISEEYLKLMIHRASTRMQRVITKKAEPVALPQSWGQLHLFNTIKA